MVAGSEQEVLERVVVARSRFDIATKHLGLHVGGRKLVLHRRSRGELPHLTLAWGNRSGEIDLHLTWSHEDSMVGAAVKRHERLATFRAEQVRELLSRAEEGMLPIAQASLTWFRRYRPGWLRRNGYILTLRDPEDFPRIRDLIVPRKREKYRLRLDRLKDQEVLTTMVELADPASLHELRHLSNSTALMAHRLRGSRHDVIMLRYSDLFGKLGWWGFNGRHLLQRGQAAVFALVRETLGKAAPEVLRVIGRVREAMLLDEVPDAADTIDNIEALVRGEVDRRRQRSGAPAPEP